MTSTPTPAKDILIQKVSAELVARLSKRVAGSAKTVHPAPKPSVSPRALPDAHRSVQMGAAEKTLQHFLAG